MPANDENAVVYGSDLIVRDPAELTALCLFYDRVYLPELNLDHDRTSDAPDEHLKRWIESYAPIHEFDERYSSLFSQTTLQRLVLGQVPEVDGYKFMGQWDLIEMFRRGFGPYSDLSQHWARIDIPFPQINSGQDDIIPRESLKLALAESTFSFLLPATNALEPDDILALREKVKDNREGFSMHLQKLSANVEGRVNAGDSHEDIAKYAQSVIETELIPDYTEFMRQLQAHDKANTANKVLAPLAKVLEIESPVTSIKFWAELAKIIGFDVLKGVADDESYTNKNQALQFMRKVDRRDA